ncbi:MAG: ribosomal subunit interface protein [Anaerolineaceae bacterium 4572_32.1]|nr:MAG: ribosomal subunit interface protein [Anaerolineaceae bacterium 4572_32.1]
MQITIQGKNIEMTDRLHEYVEEKVARLDRYLPNITEVRVELSSESARSAGHRQVAQLTVRVKGKILRAEERTDDIFASIDAMLDKMHRQIARYKGKRRSKLRAAEEPMFEEFYDEYEEEEEDLAPRIVRIKRFDMTPMGEEEAVEQMELLAHDFFVFYNIQDEGINVLYRRRDGDYGLIQPVLR